MEETTDIEIKSLTTAVKPFIRWAGGKQNLIDEIFKLVDVKAVNRYFEPFLGGASFFLKGNFSHSFLSDLNPNLINSYEQIKRNPKDVYEGLSRFIVPVTQKTYYRIREEFNQHIGELNLDQAIRFIFLNRTSFNGIYRVNKSGKYNVPFGKPNPAFTTLEQLKKISIKLQSATLFSGYFDEIGNLVQKNDLVYLDPPYPKLSDTAYFNHYTLDKFDEKQQEKVAEFAQYLANRGCKVIISNADLRVIRELYSEWHIEECSTYRYISCKSDRIKVKELIIRNK